MKLGSLRAVGRDGELTIVSRNLSLRADARDIVPTLREAIEFFTLSIDIHRKWRITKTAWRAPIHGAFK